MTPSLAGIDAKLQRSHTHLQRLFDLSSAYRARGPFHLTVLKDLVHGKTVGRLQAIRNHAIEDPDVSIVLLAGELVYQLRSALDHLVHELVHANGKVIAPGDRRHQFPIFESESKYITKGAPMIAGVSEEAAAVIAAVQPFVTHPAAPRNSLLWVLQDLSNADKHRLIPTTVHGIGVVTAYAGTQQLFIVQSPDIVLEDGKILFSFEWPEEHQAISAQIHAAIAFKSAMSPFGTTLGVEDVALSLVSEVGSVIDRFRGHFPAVP